MKILIYSLWTINFWKEYDEKSILQKEDPQQLCKKPFLLQILLADTFKQIINYPIGNKVVKELTKVKFCINSPVFAKSRSFNQRKYITCENPPV